MKTKTKLYRGEIELFFESFNHKYTVDDVPVRNITTINSVIAKPGLIPWAANEAVDYIQSQIQPGVSYDEIFLGQTYEAARKAHAQRKIDAGTMGTLVHKWVENYINWQVGGSSSEEKPAMPVNETAKKSCERFLFWATEHKVKFLLSEQPVYSKEYNYTGTLDFIAVIDGKMYIGDLKTSNAIYSEHYLQTAAYRHAREEEFPEEKYEGQVIVRVGKGDDEFESRAGGIEIAYVRGDEVYKTMFVGFLGAWKLHDVLEQLKSYRPDSL